MTHKSDKPLSAFSVPEDWTFHVIAQKLSNLAGEYFGWYSWPRRREEPKSSIFDSEAIEQGTYFEVMMILLRDATGYKHSFLFNSCPYGTDGFNWENRFYQFREKCRELEAERFSQIEDWIKDSMFKEFQELFDRVMRSGVKVEFSLGNSRITQD